MKPHGTYDTAFQAGAASRDAEVAGLNTRLDLISEASLNTTKERDQLRNQVTLLRDTLSRQLLAKPPTKTDNPIEFTKKNAAFISACSLSREALAATEPKP